MNSSTNSETERERERVNRIAKQEKNLKQQEENEKRKGTNNQVPGYLLGVLKDTIF